VRQHSNVILERGSNITSIVPVLITGVSPKSLGESIALSVASQKPALLILASRTRSKIDAVAAKIKDALPNVLLKAVLVNLSSQESVRQAAEEVNSLTNRIDVLINNAGMTVPTHQFTKEGIELQFGTNHIGPFLFTNLLMDKIRNAAKESTPGATRIVNVSSAGHNISPIRFSDYNFQGKELPLEERPPPGLPGVIFKPGPVYGGFLSYGQSKTANILMSVYLTDHLRRQGILSYSVHPGCQ
jgi:NAD(P)-dependent dehydrogenase (short-subunit alcohol dehydrogenase family)